MPASPMNGVLQPFTLLSNIVYFHDWRYVDHGYLRWLDEDEKPVNVMPAPTPLPQIHANWDWVPRGIRIEVIPCTPDSEPVVRAKYINEILFGGAVVLHEEGRYRMFYESCHPDSLTHPEKSKHIGHHKHLRYAESDNAIDWKFPKLGRVKYDGSDQNNIVFDPGKVGFHGGFVFRDDSAPPAERYKSIFMGMLDKPGLEKYLKRYPDDADPMAIFPEETAKARGFAAWADFGATSPDGFNWTLIEDPLIIQHSDTANVCTYDAFRKKYVFYTRSWFFQRRTVCRTESDDFRHFPAPDQILWPDATLAPDVTWYTPGYNTMPGAPDYHMLFPVHWSQNDDCFMPHFHSSPDGLAWSRTNQVAGVHGPAGSWYRCGFSIGTLVPLPGDRIGSLVMGWHVTHKHPRVMPGFGDCGWVSWQRGRITALRADGEGHFALYPLKFTGRKMVLNFRTKTAGRIQVAVYGKDCYHSFEDCDLITGDTLDHTVTWRGQSDLKHAPGEALQFKFKLHNADLYSVRFE